MPQYLLIYEFIQWYRKYMVNSQWILEKYLSIEPKKSTVGEIKNKKLYWKLPKIDPAGDENLFFFILPYRPKASYVMFRNFFSSHEENSIVKSYNNFILFSKTFTWLTSPGGAMVARLTIEPGMPGSITTVAIFFITTYY